MIIDAHTHINCDELYQERKEIIQRAIDNKVVAVFNTADSLNSFKNIDILQKEYPNYCYGVYGIHPEFASSTNFTEVEEEIIKGKILSRRLVKLVWIIIIQLMKLKKITKKIFLFHKFV